MNKFTLLVISIIQLSLLLTCNKCVDASNQVDSLGRCLAIKTNRYKCIKLFAVETFRNESSHAGNNFVNEVDSLTKFYSNGFKNQNKCVFEHCLETLVSCLLDDMCRKAALCNTECQTKSDLM